MFILMLLKLSGFSYPRAVSCIKRMVDVMRPAMRHVLMTLIDRVDGFIKLGSSIAKKLWISALISTNVQSEGGGKGMDQRSSHEIIGCDNCGTDTSSIEEYGCGNGSIFVTEPEGAGDDGGDNGNVSASPVLPSASQVPLSSSPHYSLLLPFPSSPPPPP
jgi:hypothetical protein